MDNQTGTKKLLDEHIATVIKNGRDIEGVLNAVGVKNLNARMNNIDIKKYFYIRFYVYFTVAKY